MLQNEIIIEKLQNLKQELNDRFGIEEIALFGSFARNEAREDSDVDITILKIKKKDYFKRAQAIYFLEEQLNRKVDMGYFDSVRTVIQNQIKKDIIYV